ncbi:hypothetical protein AB6A23_21890 [Paenibacillus tarimensis]
MNKKMYGKSLWFDDPGFDSSVPTRLKPFAQLDLNVLLRIFLFYNGNTGAETPVSLVPALQIKYISQQETHTASS